MKVKAEPPAEAPPAEQAFPEPVPGEAPADDPYGVPEDGWGELPGTPPGEVLPDPAPPADPDPGLLPPDALPEPLPGETAPQESFPQEGGELPLPPDGFFPEGSPPEVAPPTF